jgi:arylsulfatase A-like enzyme
MNLKEQSSNRRIRRGMFVMGALLFALSLSFALCPFSSAAAPRPNVLVLFSDDQRADTIAALGNPHIQTPHLDSLVRIGTAFTRAYCMGAMQGAVCVPSRAMLMSGRTLFRAKDNLLDQATWPEAFAKAGYATFISGKWHNGDASVKRAFQSGKAVFLGGMGWPYELPLKDLAGGELVNPRNSGEHSVKVFADCAAEFIQSHTKAKPAQPWLCYVAFNLPHDPRVAPEDFRKRYDDAKIPLPANFLPQHPLEIGSLVGRDELLERWPRTPENVRRHLGDYYASVTYLDAQIGRILAALDATAQRDRTLVVFASDSGLAIGSHGLFGKQSIYEHSMRAPLIFSGPGIPKGARRDAFAYLLDIFPTLGALINVSGPDGSEGRSLVGVIGGKELSVRNEVFLGYTQTQRSIRDERWKLMRFPQINVSQLFDLQTDPHETKNLAELPENKGRVAAMMTKLAQAQTTWGDTLPLSAAQPKPAVFQPPQGEKMEELFRNNRTR